MGASLQWRQPPDRENHLHGDVVEFGRARSRGRGYLAHSDRVGPGVLLLDAGGPERAAALNAEGFTVLVPEIPADRDPAPVLDAAAGFLSLNWHPRLAVLAYGADQAPALTALGSANPAFDLLVLHECLPTGRAATVPVVGHFSSEGDVHAVRAFFASTDEAAGESELFVYQGTRVGFCDPRAPAFAPEAAALADERTIDALEYHLS